MTTEPTSRPDELGAAPCSELPRCAAVRSSELVLLHRLLGAIDIRRRSAQRELKDAIENKQWSKVPGWDGIDIGLMMAEKTLKDEMQPNDVMCEWGAALAQLEKAIDNTQIEEMPLEHWSLASVALRALEKIVDAQRLHSHEKAHL